MDDKSKRGQTFLENSWMVRNSFARSGENGRQRQMVAIHARNISNCWLLIFHLAKAEEGRRSPRRWREG
jgi:hypothetical protein